MSANVNEYEGERGDCEWGSVSEVGRGWGRTYRVGELVQECKWRIVSGRVSVSGNMSGGTQMEESEWEWGSGCERRGVSGGMRVGKCAGKCVRAEVSGRAGVSVTHTSLTRNFRRSL